MSGSASSGLPVTYTSTIPTICTAAGDQVTLLMAGTCTITASQPGNSVYNAAAAVMQSFEVKQDQTITFPQSADASLTDSPVTVSATASSGLPVTYTSATPSICTVSGAQATLLSTATCTITASQAGNSDYYAAADVSRSFAVTSDAPVVKKSQTITFPDPGTVRLDESPVTLSETASSGLAVTHTSATSKICTVTSDQVALLKAGTCTITASQAGNSEYQAAADVSRSFAVKKPKTDVKVTATSKKKDLRVGKRTRLVKAVVKTKKGDDSWIRSKTQCIYQGVVLRGADKERICGFELRKQGGAKRAGASGVGASAKEQVSSKLVVTATPTCTTDLKLKVRLKAWATGSRVSNWGRSWGMNDSDPVRCSLSGNG
ncbi:MAG: hypothetical protein KDC39_05055 [Actinobacteria bacterium]|nr:hypothetical protein [Actinomycetota bacterium]